MRADVRLGVAAIAPVVAIGRSRRHTGIAAWGVGAEAVVFRVRAARADEAGIAGQEVVAERGAFCDGCDFDLRALRAREDVVLDDVAR